jgi:hypothetical protein
MIRKVELSNLIPVSYAMIGDFMIQETECRNQIGATKESCVRGSNGELYRLHDWLKS